MKDDSGQTELRKLGLFAVLVGELAGCSLVGVGLGYLAVKRWNAPWWVLVVSSVLGLVVAFTRIYRISKKEL